MTILVSPPSSPPAPGPGLPTTPQRVQMLTAAIAVLALVLGLVIAQGAASVRDGFADIGRRTAPQVAVSSDLYVALSDMDGLVANVLLIGNDEGLVVTRANALAMYEQRRSQAHADLQQAATLADGDWRAQQAVRTVLDGLSEYESLTNQAMRLNTHAPGKPPQIALGLQRQATDLMQTRLLPAADGLIEVNRNALERTYEKTRSDVRQASVLTALAALALLGALIALQALLARRFRRRYNPVLLLVTLAAGGLFIASMVLFAAEDKHLRTAKEDAFNSLLALSRARAVGYDANADESRYLLDGLRAGRYEQSYLNKTQRIVGLPTAKTLGYYHHVLNNEMSIHSDVATYVGWGGYFGIEFRNITFPGERPAAEKALQNFAVYQASDASMREQFQRGEVKAAIRSVTSYEYGNANYSFDEYDKSLNDLIQLKRWYFERSIRAGEDTARGWERTPWVIVIAVAGLAYIAVRPRLAEYR
jgi:hypothetical protein